MFYMETSSSIPSNQEHLLIAHKHWKMYLRVSENEHFVAIASLCE